MLTSEEEAVLNRGIHTILKDPASLTLQLYITVYNTVYSYCNKPTEVYYIEGGAIYELLHRSIRDYTNSLTFKASIKDLSEQAAHFQRIGPSIEKLFSYVERFYIKTAVFKGEDVENLKDLFYIHLYFNYIYKIEDNFIGLVFLELDSMRNSSNQNCKELRNIVGMYMEALRIAGQESKTERFYRMYIENYTEGMDFRMSIGGLLRNTYLELYYVKSIMNDKELAKEVVSKIGHRGEEAILYAIEQIGKYRSCKIEYKVISVMDNEVKHRFKKEYERLLKREFRRCDGVVVDVYRLFCRVKEHMMGNCMGMYGKMLSKVVKGSFMDITEEKQKEMMRKVVEMIGKEIEGNGNDRDIGIDVDRDIDIDRDKDIDKHINIDKDININKDKDKLPLKIKESIKSLFDFYVIIQNDYALEYFMIKCQHRLLGGMNPKIELEAYNMLAKLVGNGVLTRLKSVITTYLTPKYLDRYSICRILSSSVPPSQSLGISILTAKISLLKHVSGFWHIEKQSLNLHSLLAAVKEELVSREELKHRECMNVNYSLSPVIFEMNNTKYKMGSNLFSMLLHVHSSKEGLTEESLRKKTGDGEFESNFKKLIDWKILNREGVDGTVKITNNKRNEIFVDLFENTEIILNGEEPENIGSQRNNIVESVICRFMKRYKSINIGELYNRLFEEYKGKTDYFISIGDVEGGIIRLIDKGYLSKEEGVIEYVP